MVKHQVPDDWKTANITAIYKKGKRSDAGNYRPVSLTCIACKIFESIIRDNLMKHLLDNDLLSDQQYGFVKGRSTSLQLLKVLDDWSKILEGGGSVDTIYLDFKKAFDTVPHNRLIQKLRGYGIGDNIVRWIEAFLTDRTHKVTINGNTSKSAPVTSGIPQGSVLGPVLFILYINDLPDNIKSKIYLFADDTKIYRQIIDDKDNEILQEDLDRLCEWSDKWLLKFHPGKCHVLDIGKPRENYNYSLDNTILKHVNEEKDLGVTTDKQLKFRSHISEKVNKGNTIAGVIRRSFNDLNQINFTRLFTALVRPHLEYAQAVWSPYWERDIEVLENVQRRATKQVNGIQEKDYAERLRALKLPSLVYRRLRGDMIECYKLTNNLYDSKVSDILTLHQDKVEMPNRTRGHNKKLYVNKADRVVRRNSFAYRVTDTWNNLPYEVVNSSSLNIFKNSLDRLWETEDIKYNFKKAFNKLKARKLTP